MKRAEAAEFQQTTLDEALAAARGSDGYAGNLIRSELLSVGVYTLAAGETDTQTPHVEDEVYYAVSGRARFRAGDEDVSVGPGSLLFVRARVAHAFYDIKERLVLVVFWAPPEGEQ